MWQQGSFLEAAITIYSENIHFFSNCKCVPLFKACGKGEAQVLEYFKNT